MELSRLQPLQYLRAFNKMQELCERDRLSLLPLSHPTLTPLSRFPEPKEYCKIENIFQSAAAKARVTRERTTTVHVDDDRLMKKHHRLVRNVIEGLIKDSQQQIIRMQGRSSQPKNHELRGDSLPHFNIQKVFSKRRGQSLRRLPTNANRQSSIGMNPETRKMKSESIAQSQRDILSISIEDTRLFIPKKFIQGNMRKGSAKLNTNRKTVQPILKQQEGEGIQKIKSSVQSIELRRSASLKNSMAKSSVVILHSPDAMLEELVRKAEEVQKDHLIRQRRFLAQVDESNAAFKKETEERLLQRRKQW